MDWNSMVEMKDDRQKRFIAAYHLLDAKHQAAVEEFLQWLLEDSKNYLAYLESVKKNMPISADLVWKE